MCIYTSLRQRHLPMDGYPKPQSLIIARNYQMSRFDQIWELRDYYKHLISINSNQGLPMFYHICSMKAKILSMMCARKVGATRHRCTYLRCRVLSTNGVRSLSIDISTKLSCEGLRPSAARKTMDSHQTGKGWNNLSDESSFLFKRLGHFKLLPWWISNHGDSKGKINAPSNYISERRTIQVTTAGRLTFFLSPDPPFPFVAEGDMDFRGRSKNLTIKGLSFSYIMKRGKCNHCRAAGIAMNMFMMISTTNPAMILILIYSNLDRDLVDTELR